MSSRRRGKGPDGERRSSVATHLGITLSEYDRRIRSFIPHYDEMLDAAVLPVDPNAGTVLDIGIGTGALAVRCLRVAPGAALVGIDADPAMIAIIQQRLGGRASVICGDFRRVAFPRIDVAVSSLALHHVRTRPAKARLYRRIFRALSAGGVFVSADCCPADDHTVAALQERAWRAHLRQQYTSRETPSYFRSWQREDAYGSLNAEMQLFQAAGFRTEVIWRRGPFAVIAGHRPDAA
jgi:tRNA (cmo5U34)-methyltransferase